MNIQQGIKIFTSLKHLPQEYWPETCDPHCVTYNMHRKVGKWIKQPQLDTARAFNKAFRIKTKAFSS